MIINDERSRVNRRMSSRDHLLLLIIIKISSLPFKIQASNPKGRVFAESFLASLALTIASRINPLLEVISLRSPTRPL